MDRRKLLRLALAGLSSASLQRLSFAESRDTVRPNIILVMSDDQGWGDTGYNGHPVLQTPHLDAMARTGLLFERFYSGAPVCSPTRGSCITGRHPFRYGIFGANAANGPFEPSKYPLPDQEVTLAEVLKRHGYTTGHFGKWHLGDLTGSQTCTPSQNGFDEWFSTVRKVSTVDPEGYVENGKEIKTPLMGDDSKIIMDRAEPFIRKSIAQNNPFFAVVWFHTPHLPVYATPDYQALYADHTERESHYWGAITAMDAQIGRLRSMLDDLNISGNTMLWFCSDNGPTHVQNGPGSTGGLRGSKGQLFEGGIRVPGILVWPDKIKSPRTTPIPCSTSDYFPTIIDYLSETKTAPQPLDGISLRPLIEGGTTKRGKFIGFEHREGAALIGDRYKLIANIESDQLSTPMLFDIIADPNESKDIASENTDTVRSMMEYLRAWQASCTESRNGKDYGS